MHNDAQLTMVSPSYYQLAEIAISPPKNGIVVVESPQGFLHTFNLIPKVLVEPILSKFKVLMFDIFKGVNDHVKHLDRFKDAISSRDVSNTPNYKIFFITFNDSIKIWYSKMSASSISSVEESVFLFSQYFTS